jgi:hypothetical protein
MVTSNGPNCRRNETAWREQMILIFIAMLIVCLPIAVILKILCDD